MRSLQSLPFGFGGCPVTGKKADGRGWVDTGRTIRVKNKMEPLIISYTGCHLLGKYVGMKEPEEASEQDKEMFRLRALVAQLEQELYEIDTVVGAVDVLESKDYRARKKQGRPKRRPQEAEEE